MGLAFPFFFLRRGRNRFAVGGEQRGKSHRVHRPAAFPRCAAMQGSSTASLPLEITLFFNRFYSALVFIVTLLIFIFKAVMLPYPPNVLGLEVAFVFLYGIVEWVRLRQGA
jgi:hypothetical protein